jgi:DNA/RNA endonuclease G (NUC1)
MKFSAFIDTSILLITCFSISSIANAQGTIYGEESCECSEGTCELKFYAPTDEFEEKELKTTTCSLPAGSTTNGILIEIRKKLSPNKLIYTICFDPNKEATYYTKHTFTSTSATSTSVNWYTSRTYYTTISPTVSYDHECGKQSNPALRIHKGHLTPAADFTGSEKDATYFYQNSHPQYATINAQGGNWQRMEAYVRTLPSPIKIITGTHGWIRDIGRKSDSMLVTGKLPISKYSWKLVYTTTLVPSRGVVFVTLNDPTSSAAGPNYGFCTGCTNVCSSLTWIPQTLLDNFKVPSKGLTTCLSLQDFQNVITTLGIPNYAVWTR